MIALAVAAQLVACLSRRLLFSSARFSNHSQINDLFSKWDQKITHEHDSENWIAAEFTFTVLLPCTVCLVWSNNNRTTGHAERQRQQYGPNKSSAVDCFPNSERSCPAPRRPNSIRTRPGGRLQPPALFSSPASIDMPSRARRTSACDPTLLSCAVTTAAAGPGPKRPSADEARAWRLPSPPTRGVSKRSRFHEGIAPLGVFPCARSS